MYLQRNSSATTPTLRWSTNRRKETEARSFHFRTILLLEKNNDSSNATTRELRLFSVKFLKARSQDIRVSAPRLTIDRDTLQLWNLPVPSKELTIRRQFVRYWLHAIYTFPGSFNYGTAGRTLCDIRKWTWNNQCGTVWDTVCRLRAFYSVCSRWPDTLVNFISSTVCSPGIRSIIEEKSEAHVIFA